MSTRQYFEQVRKVANKSPYYRHLGMEVTKIKQGESTIRMVFKEELTRYDGIVHGGAIASLADAAAGVAIASLLKPKDRVVAIEFKINFFAPVSKGELTARAKVIHKGSRTAVADVEVINEDAKIVAKLVVTSLIG
jgi:uncharacterized protein (TIGR00369 family)